MSQPFAPPHEIAALRAKAWTAGAVGLVALAAGYFVDREQFFRSYLVAWLWVLGIALGCYAVALLHQLTRGAWGLMIRRPLGAATRTLPFVALLFLPLAFGLQELFVWARPEALAADPALQQKTWYLNPAGFYVRFVLYFLIWTAPMWWLNRLSLQQDEQTSDRTFRRMQRIAAPALVLYCLAATLASVDWVMSLDPHWYSSIWGVYFIGGHAVSAFSFAILIALYLSQREPMKRHLQRRHFHDYGKLLLAFVMLWTYFQLSQLIIIWSGDIPEEVTFYLNRIHGGWRWVTVLLILVHFALPFVLLLSRDLKRDARKLAGVAALLLVMRWVDLYWQAAPSFGHGAEHASALPHWMDLAAIVGLGGVWFGVYLTQLGRRPLLPAFEPYLKEALEHE